MKQLDALCFLLRLERAYDGGFPIIELMRELKPWLDRQRVEQVSNWAAEDGDPDVMALGMRAMDGDGQAIEEALEIWKLWRGEERLERERAISSEGASDRKDPHGRLPHGQF